MESCPFTDSFLFDFRAGKVAMPSMQYDRMERLNRDTKLQLTKLATAVQANATKSWTRFVENGPFSAKATMQQTLAQQRSRMDEQIRQAMFSIAALSKSASTVIMGSPDEAKATKEDLSKPFSGVYAEDPRWIDRLTLSEYVALLAVAVTAPMAIALGIGKGVRMYQVRKYGKYCRGQAENYLKQVVQFKPKYLARIMPSIPPEDNPIPKNKPHPTPYPPVFDPAMFPSFIPQQGWRLDDPELIRDAQERIKKMTDIELRMFHILMTQWSHNPAFNEIIRMTIRWVAYGEAKTHDYVLGFLPAAAVDDLPPEDREQAKKMHSLFRRAQVRQIIDADVYGFGSGSQAFEENPQRKRPKDRPSLGKFMVDLPDGTKEEVDLEDIVVVPGLSSVHAKRIVELFEALERIRMQEREKPPTAGSQQQQQQEQQPQQQQQQ